MKQMQKSTWFSISGMPRWCYYSYPQMVLLQWPQMVLLQWPSNGVITVTPKWCYFSDPKQCYYSDPQMGLANSDPQTVLANEHHFVALESVKLPIAFFDCILVSSNKCILRQKGRDKLDISQIGTIGLCSWSLSMWRCGIWWISLLFWYPLVRHTIKGSFVLSTVSSSSQECQRNGKGVQTDALQKKTKMWAAVC